MDDDDFSHFSIELQKVVDDTSMLAVTRLLASKLIQNPYTRVQDFFVSLSDYDLSVLSDIINDIREEELNEAEEYSNPHSCEILLIADMLARAEGVNSQNLTESTGIMNAFMGFVTVESLYRKNLVNIFREHFSFGEDMKDKVICTRRDDIDYSGLLDRF
jgi:hypothetical protein